MVALQIRLLIVALCIFTPTKWRCPCALCKAHCLGAQRPALTFPFGTGSNGICFRLLSAGSVIINLSKGLSEYWCATTEPLAQVRSSSRARALFAPWLPCQIRDTLDNGDPLILLTPLSLPLINLIHGAFCLPLRSNELFRLHSDPGSSDRTPVSQQQHVPLE